MMSADRAGANCGSVTMPASTNITRIADFIFGLLSENQATWVAMGPAPIGQMLAPVCGRRPTVEANHTPGLTCGAERGGDDGVASLTQTYAAIRATKLRNVTKGGPPGKG